MRAREVHARLAELASHQHGLVTAPQARAAGVTYVRLTRMSQSGALRRVAHGVYVLADAPADSHRDLRAAWLALDPEHDARARLADPAAGAVVSHFCAAALHGIAPAGAQLEFIVPGRKQSRRGDVRLRRGSLAADDIAVAHGLPVTTIERLLVDLLSDGADLDAVAALYCRATADAPLRDDLVDRLEPLAARRGFAPRDGRGLLARLAAARPQVQIVG